MLQVVSTVTNQALTAKISKVLLDQEMRSGMRGTGAQVLVNGEFRALCLNMNG